MSTENNPQMHVLPLESLLVHDRLPVDVFLPVGGRYLIVAKLGTPSDSLAKYKEKNVDAVFVRLADYQHLVNLAIQEASGAGQPTASIEQRLKGLQTAMASVYREIETLGFDESAFTHAKMINSVTLNVIVKNPRLTDLALNFEGNHGDLVQHTMLVSLVATMLGVSNNWVKPGTIEKLALGGFLHDVGKTKLPKEIYAKFELYETTGENTLTNDEMVIYQGHAEAGANLLAAAKSVPEDVILMAREHHELADGSGFPRGIKDFQISPLTRIISLANVFTDELRACGHLPVPERGPAILARLGSRQRHFNKGAFEALQRLLGGARGGKVAV